MPAQLWLAGGRRRRSVEGGEERESIYICDFFESDAVLYYMYKIMGVCRPCADACCFWTDGLYGVEMIDKQGFDKLYIH